MVFEINEKLTRVDYMFLSAPDFDDSLMPGKRPPSFHSDDGLKNMSYGEIEHVGDLISVELSMRDVRMEYNIYEGAIYRFIRASTNFLGSFADDCSDDDVVRRLNEEGDSVFGEVCISSLEELSGRNTHFIVNAKAIDIDFFYNKNQFDQLIFAFERVSNCILSIEVEPYVLQKFWSGVCDKSYSFVRSAQFAFSHGPLRTARF